MASVPELTHNLVSKLFDSKPTPSPPLTNPPPPSPDNLHMPEERVDVCEEERSKCTTGQNVATDVGIVSSPCDSIPASSSLTGQPPEAQRSSEKLRSRALPFLKRLTPALRLQNQGSVARDHLASERTFLAYVRTSLAIASTGVALVQLFSISSHITSNGTSFTPSQSKLQKLARPLGAITILMALAVLAIGTTRYFSIQKALTKGVFSAARLTVMAITIVLALLVVTLFGALVRG